jgi:hypothetical protein
MIRKSEVCKSARRACELELLSDRDFESDEGVRRRDGAAAVDVADAVFAGLERGAARIDAQDRCRASLEVTEEDIGTAVAVGDPGDEAGRG